MDNNEQLKQSNKLNKHCVVTVNITANAQGSDRVAMNTHMTLDDLGLGDCTASTPPDWPSVEASIKEVMGSALTMAEKKAKAAELMANYTAQVEEHNQKAGGNITDLIAQKIAEQAQKSYGFANDNKSGKPVLRPEHVLVTQIPTQDGSFVFNVTGTSVWG